MTLWLIGMMGVGKTSVGRLAARNLSVGFVDTDEMIESEIGTTIPEYWSDHGESAFRAVEESCVVRASTTGGIIATGGGVVLSAGNRAVIRRTGRCVWLEADPNTLVERLDGTDSRPLMSDTSISSLALIAKKLEERSRFYSELADAQIDTAGSTVESIARKLEEIWAS